VLWQRLDQIARNVSPFAITVLLLIIGLVPLRLPYLPPLSVSLVLVSVYYWAIHRPSALPEHIAHRGPFGCSWPAIGSNRPLSS
jgi:rod shape-determining protein MreD